MNEFAVTSYPEGVAEWRRRSATLSGLNKSSPPQPRVAAQAATLGYHIEALWAKDNNRLRAKDDKRPRNFSEGFPFFHADCLRRIRAPRRWLENRFPCRGRDEADGLPGTVFFGPECDPLPDSAVMPAGRSSTASVWRVRRWMACKLDRSP